MQAGTVHANDTSNGHEASQGIIAKCGGNVGISKLIVLNSFTAKSSCPATIVAHEIGHAAGQPDHRDRSGKKGDYMGFTCPRNHYHEQDLPLVCGARLRF